jgi:hypothetical protein
MVSAALFNFISQLFANIHNNDIAFGGINIMVVGDLAQLPPVGATQVFHSTTWHFSILYFFAKHDNNRMINCSIKYLKK